MSPQSAQSGPGQNRPGQPLTRADVGTPQGLETAGRAGPPDVEGTSGHTIEGDDQGPAGQRTVDPKPADQKLADQQLADQQLADQAAADRRAGVLRGIGLMCAGVCTFPFMNAAVKLLSAHYPSTQITWARFTGHLIVMLLIFAPQYRWSLFRTRKPLVQTARSACMLLSNLLFVMAIGHVPLADASAIGFTSPLIVTALSVPLLGESVGWRRWTAVLVGFAGALLVIRPGAGLTDPAVLLILLSSLTYALYQIATRWVGRYDGAATGIVFAALLGSLVMTLVMPFVFVMPRSWLDTLLFLSLGLLGGLGHYLVIRAFQLGPAAVIAPLGYVELVGSTVLGYALFGHFPDLWTWVGASVIIASGAYIALRERRRRDAATS